MIARGKCPYTLKTAKATVFRQLKKQEEQHFDACQQGKEQEEGNT